MLAPKTIGIFSQLRSLIKKKLALGHLIKFKILREKHTHTHTNDKTNGGWKSTNYENKNFKSGFNNNKNNNRRIIQCRKCNKIGHTSEDCKSNIKCNNCNKMGHYTKECRYNSNNNKRNDNKFDNNKNKNENKNAADKSKNKVI